MQLIQSQAVIWISKKTDRYDWNDWNGFEDKNHWCLNDIEPYMKYDLQS